MPLVATMAPVVPSTAHAALQECTEGKSWAVGMSGSIWKWCGKQLVDADGNPDPNGAPIHSNKNDALGKQTRFNALGVRKKDDTLFSMMGSSLIVKYKQGETPQW